MKAIYLTFFVLAMLCSTANASQDKDLPSIFQAASQSVGVPQNVIIAIAKVESGFNPWALNIEGRSYHFDTKAGAVAKADEALKAGQSFDVGLMQINNWWLKRFNIPLADAFNPETNIYFGSWILKQEMERHGDLWLAVGAYHSPKPARANSYARKVKAVWKDNPQIKASTDLLEAPQKKRLPIVKTGTHIKLDFSTPMLVSSRSAVLVSNHHMKAATTAVDNSMKVRLKNEN